MASKVDIANRALSMLGEIRITSLSDNSKPARAMNARFDIIRDAELMNYPWRFAVKRTQLAASTSTPSWGYSTIYDLPVDNLRAIKVGGFEINDEAIGVMYTATGYNVSEDAPYEIIEGKIHTNLSAPLDYEYLARITDTGQYDALFVEVLAAALAVDACEELTQSDSKQRKTEYAYHRALTRAKRNNALQRPPRQRAASRWMASRIVG